MIFFTNQNKLRRYVENKVLSGTTEESTIERVDINRCHKAVLAPNEPPSVATLL